MVKPDAETQRAIDDLGGAFGWIQDIVYRECLPQQSGEPRRA
jgi:hypothetical protein